MKFDSIGRSTWRCAPSLAAFVVSRVAWTTDGELLIDDLERTNPLAKRLQITMDDELILEIHCMLDGDGGTSVEFLIPDGVGAEAEVVARGLAVAAIGLARRERLVQRPVGFGR